MKTLDRYVAREFIRLFLLFAIAAPLLFVIGDWTDRIDEYSRDGITLGNVALAYLYQMPKFMSWSLPVAALIATVFTVNTMTRHSEMTAAKAGGVSFFRALAVLPVLGIGVVALGFALTELTPIGISRSYELLGKTSNVDMRHDAVYIGPEGHTYTMRRVIAEGPSIGGLTVELPSDGQRPMVHISAPEATRDSTGHWVLQNGIYRLINEQENTELSFRFQQMRIDAFTETTDELLARVKDSEEMRYEELGRFIRSLERSGTEPRKLMVERAQKLAIPMATMVIILFGAPLANSSARGGAAYGIGISLGVTILYLMALNLTAAAAVAGLLSPELAAWSPNILFLLAALLLIVRVRT